MSSAHWLRWLGACTLLIPAARAQAEWPHWGGPDRTWRLPRAQPPIALPAEGPTIAWRTTLDDAGHGGLVAAGGRLFGLIRRNDRDVAVAWDTATGAVVWETSLAAPSEVELDYGDGPFATPAIDGDRAWFVGGTGILRCHDRRSGELVWQLDLEDRFDCPRPDRGHAASPLLVDGALILPLGARGASIVAFDAATGRVLWARHDDDHDYGSAVAVRVDEQLHIVCQMADRAVGVDAASGARLWEFATDGTRTRNCMTPADLGDGTVVVGTSKGTWRLDLRQIDGETRRPKTVWASTRIRAQVGNYLFLPQHRVFLGPNSAHPGSRLVALDVDSGALLWRDRGIDCGFVWTMGDQLLAVASDGELVVARADRAGLTVESSANLLPDNKNWSAPAVAGGRLFVKGTGALLAIELGNP
ncbi:MAG: PQQ-binding-like beta-propeller repeat protein [Planctomycetota bacterium]